MKTAVLQLNPTNENSDYDESDDEDREPVLEGYLTEYVKTMHICDQMVNDKGKQYLLALLNLACAFHSNTKV